MPDLPTGTVTFLFTDIAGSTRLLETLGTELYSEALAEHRRVVRDVCARHGGVEVDTQGDAFFLAFPNAQDAVGAAEGILAGLAAGRVAVRMGLHTGTPSQSGEGYVGADVHLGARIAAAGHPGQVLMSGATRGLVAADGIDLGKHRIKDFDAPVSIYQLGNKRFPPLRTIANTNLPRPASSFVGRHREVAEVVALLRNGARLVTLTGPGGTGKTRLAIEAGTELVPSNSNGVFWVDLAALADPAMVLSEIEQTLGAKDGVPEHIGSGEMMLLLDNFEQVIEAAPHLSKLLTSCPNLRLLVTSRERLRISGEVEYAVPPLADPEAVELFVARSGIPGDETVVELCRRLDNLPLAIELAAARTGVMSSAQILGRLSRRLDMLRGGRDSEARQQTLRATIEWSHDLLTDVEKDLFARLAVFRGGCTLEAAEQVITAELDVLESLADKSLVRHTDERFWMLETIREYALEQLEASGEADGLRLRHAEHFLSIAEEAEDKLYSPDVDEWCDILERDHENLRAAMDHLEAIGNFQASMRLASAIVEFWDERAHSSEALLRYTRLVQADPSPTIARAKTLDAASHMAAVSGDMADALRWNQEALDLFRELDDERGITIAMWGMGYLAVETGDYAKAEPILNEVVERLARLGNETLLAWATRTLAFCHEEIGNHERSKELHQENLARARRLGDQPLEAAALGALSSFAIEEGRQRDAALYSRRSLELAGSMRDLMQAVSRICAAANILALLGSSSAAAQLLAAGESQYEVMGAREPWVERMNNATLDLIRGAIDEHALTAALEEGRTLSLEAAVEMGVAALDQWIGEST